MSSITEQFSAVTKSQLEAQFQILNTLASTAVDSAEKVIALNLNTTRASVEKSSAAAKQWLSARDPKEFLSLSTPQAGSFDALLSYGRELYSIATSAQNELVRSARSSFSQIGDLAANKATAAAKATPPALAAAVSAAVTAVNQAAEAPVPKVPKAKPVAAPIPEQQEFIEVKAEVKPSFPAPPPKPLALAADAKPPKAAPKARK